MKIGIIGSGRVAQTLAEGFLDHGYDVMMGSRTVVTRDDELCQRGTFAQTAAFGDLLVLAVKGSVAQSALDLCGDLKEKVIIDVTNPISDEPPVNGVLKFFTTLDKSLMEILQEKHPKVKFVKAFNSIGSAHMVNPDFKGVKPTMFICGNDVGAKEQVKKIVEQFGFEAQDMGAAEAARAIEPLCMLWCIPGFLHNEWNHAFKLLKK